MVAAGRVASRAAKTTVAVRAAAAHTVAVMAAAARVAVAGRCWWGWRLRGRW